MIIPKTSVRSIIFEPRRIPNPSPGSPFKVEIIEIVDSGITEIRAMIKKLTMNSCKWRTFASLDEYLIEYFAPLININKNIKKRIKFIIIIVSF